MNIRRSVAYGIAAAAVLASSMLMPMSTPDWYGITVFSLACALACGALFFNAQEKKAGQTKKSIGLFALGVMVIIFVLMMILPLLP